MAEDLSRNPFSALFTSTNEAIHFTQNQLPIDVQPAIAEAVKSSNDTVHMATSGSEPISYSNQAKEKLEINQIVEDVFHLTLNKETRTRSQLVYLEDFALAVTPQDWIDVETLEQALFERLLLDEPAKHVISTNNSLSSVKVDVHATQKLVITYLFECHKRLSEINSNENVSRRKELISKMMEFVLRNAAVALRQNELFDGQDLHSQLIELFFDENSSSDLTSFFHGISDEFKREDGEKGSIHSLLIAFQTILDKVHKEMAQSSLFSFKNSYFELILIFATNNQLASVLLAHSTPASASGVLGIAGRLYADSLLGAILCISCLPKTSDGMFEYFDKQWNIQEAPSIMEENVWRAIQTIQEQLYQVFHSLLKCSPDVKHRTLCWLSDCLHSNSARGQLWNSHSAYPSPDATLCVSDGFMLNLGGVLLRLTQPFCSNSKDTKMLRIDPTYCAATVTSENEMLSKGVHLRAMDEETCLIPSLEGTPRPVAKSYGFVTECFFLTHRCLDLGFRVVTERLMKLNQDIARIQRVFQDAQSQANNRPEVVQALQERIEVDLTRYQSLRASLVEPKSLAMTAQLHVATSIWLVQVTLDLGLSPRQNYAPNTFRTLTFPIQDEVIDSLRCVPEFLIENICCFLSFVRRFSPLTLESQGFTFLEPVLTMLLVFMGTVKRTFNPHLRARMAEALEALLPDKNLPQFSAQTVFYRERLFKEHPHRKEIVVNLLDVFVGIEMTGQSVAFEQKFNYRRPMYIVMDYLWQIDFHQACFRRLAVEAEANMEAVTPPLFLRFVNLLINDAVFLLDEALTNMAQLKQMQTAREAGEWQQLSAQEREQNEGYLQHIGMIARFDNILGRETIQTLKFLTSKITSIFCHPTMVDRMAAMLNYFLCHLVGPKMKNFKVKDHKEFDFEPANIVMDICKIYVHLYKSDSFCLAVSQDGRSYSPQLFQLAEDVLARIGGGSLIADLQSVATKVAEINSKQQAEEEIMLEAPEEYLDPIMNTLMLDPVVLPSSRTVVDRSTIARHLLSDQTDPFNRSPLTMDLVKSNNELKAEIEAWVREKKQQRACSSK